MSVAEQVIAVFSVVKGYLDDVELNEKCVRFPENVKQEDTHFPGITSSELNELDKKQFQSNFLYNE